MQESITNATANLFGNAGAGLMVVVAAAVLALGAEQISSLLEVRLPWRQLMVGRSWPALTLSCRFFCAILGSYISARVRHHRPLM
jgi:hypothetical protein